MTDLLGILSIVALSLSIILVWSKNSYIWLFSYCVFLVSGLLSAWITPSSLVSLVVFALIIRASKIHFEGYKRYVVNVLVVVCALVSGVHLAPGFENIYLFENTQLSENTGWSALRFSADKASFGLFMLVVYRDQLCTSFQQLKSALILGMPFVLAGILVIYGIGLGIGFVSVDVTVAAVIIVWFLRNLLFTVVAEEMLFRGFIQQKLEFAISTKNGHIIALLGASIFFGAVHLYAGWKYGLLATIAGVMYGYVYQRTRRIELSFLAHVLLNTGHVILLSYP